VPLSFPLSGVIVNTSSPSIAIANNRRSSNGYATETNNVGRFIAEALPRISSKIVGITPALVGKAAAAEMATVLADTTGWNKRM